LSIESFRPVSNGPPTTLVGKVKFYGRMIVDLQVLTVYRDLRRNLADVEGSVLDVGCGESPYRFLLNQETTHYTGIDLFDADKFDSHNPDVIPFDGVHIPFPADQFDTVICTEVLEHVEDFQGLVDEIHRVMKDGAMAIVTVPWSARYHYVPYDFYRFTPSSLANMFTGFREVQIIPRGTDISVIGSKMVVVWFRNLLPAALWRLLFIPFWVLISPVLLLALAVAHLAILGRVGSQDDPLGYTVLLTK
jgi:SAM-dependent methyltransferase